MTVECAHDARHVNALFIRIQRDGTCHRGFQLQRAIVASFKSDRQAKIGNAHVLNMALSAPNERRRPILKIGQAPNIFGIRLKNLRVDPAEL